MQNARDARQPARSEYADCYHGYVQSAPSGEIVQVLRDQRESTLQVFGQIPPDKGAYGYADGKWSINELIGHMLDTEWIFTYRALRFARGDTSPLVGMDQDEFVAGANFDDRELSSLIAEFAHVRAANVTLFESFDESVMQRKGTAFDCPFTVRSLLHIIAGHTQHHLNVLLERYS
ncbi:MAG: DinB family protein [bacterium]|nr:DinB family protein [bacterium]